MNSNIVIVDAPDASDGDPTHRPEGAQYKLCNPPNIYLEKLGTGWMKHRGKAKPGMRYFLKKLPTGYEVYEKTRANGAQVGRTDRWLYGYPGHKWFDSPNRFLPHFIHLLDNDGSNIGCNCTVCLGSAGKSRMGRASTGSTAGEKQTTTAPTAKPRNRPPGKSGPRKIISKPAPTGPTDEEGTPDVYRILIDRLKKAGSMDVPITEQFSMDWRAEHEQSTNQLDEISRQPGWVPRVGEIVLFVRTLKEGQSIGYHAPTRTYRIRSSEDGKQGSLPAWEAGVVTLTSMDELEIDDLLQETENHHEYQVNYSGFRVEPLPDPNSADKSLSKRHKYVPVSQMRPFVFWQQILQNLKQGTWHTSIVNAMKTMSSFSLRDKFHFSGTWPTAAISCRGIYIGSELIIAGDVVRLRKVGEETISDIMRISSIKLRLQRLDEASDNDNDDRHPYNLSVHITGKTFTTDISKAYDEEEIDPADHGLEAFAEYSTEWYLRHPQNKKLEVPFFRIMGRCYETDAMEKWLPPDATNLSVGLDGIIDGRAYSEKHDKRILEGKTWFWGEHRADSLGVETLNGQEVSKFDPDRDPKKWRRQIRVLEGIADEKERQALKKQTMNHRPLRGYEQGNSMVDAAMHLEEAAGNFESEAASAAEDTEGRSSRKRSRSVAENSRGRDEADDEEEDEDDEDVEAAVDDFIFELAEDVARPKGNVMVELDEDDADGEQEQHKLALPSKRRRH
ncbi:hypothetical protein NA57DRAFT_48274 [Rhizodiscina lignyota]|uniref:Cryptic loci regulator 2 N-terminal domain-containing protein n=1 Tax=Rhizodiscina lignyota TaxID=1504668 RepID=A0A9P4M559_9PEZI|nr:hypothetical protein NA57DRAFT_48274 [Rhizodiscina lignyota]